MDKITVGVMVGILGLVSFIQSFATQGTAQYIYFGVGVVLAIGGTIYAAKQIRDWKKY